MSERPSSLLPRTDEEAIPSIGTLLQASNWEDRVAAARARRAKVLAADGGRSEEGAVRSLAEPASPPDPTTGDSTPPQAPAAPKGSAPPPLRLVHGSADDEPATPLPAPSYLGAFDADHFHWVNAPDAGARKWKEDDAERYEPVRPAEFIPFPARALSEREVEPRPKRRIGAVAATAIGVMLAVGTGFGLGAWFASTEQRSMPVEVTQSPSPADVGSVVGDGPSSVGAADGADRGPAAGRDTPPTPPPQPTGGTGAEGAPIVVRTTPGTNDVAPPQPSAEPVPPPVARAVVPSPGPQADAPSDAGVAEGPADAAEPASPPQLQTDPAEPEQAAVASLPDAATQAPPPRPSGLGEPDLSAAVSPPILADVEAPSLPGGLDDAPDLDGRLAPIAEIGAAISGTAAPPVPEAVTTPVAPSPPRAPAVASIAAVPAPAAVASTELDLPAERRLSIQPVRGAPLASPSAPAPRADSAPLEVAALPPATPAAPAAPATPDLSRYTVYLHAPTGSGEGSAAEATASLSAAGYSVADPIPVGFDVGSDHVRFYRAEDGAAARAVAEALGGEARDFTSYRPRPAPGTIEVWLTSR